MVENLNLPRFSESRKSAQNNNAKDAGSASKEPVAYIFGSPGREESLTKTGRRNRLDAWSGTNEPNLV